MAVVDKLVAALTRRWRWSETAATMVLVIDGLFCLLLAVGLVVIFLIYPFEKPMLFATGLLLGSLFSVAKVLLMEKSLNRTADGEQKTAQNYAALQAILRFGLTIAVLLTAVFFPKVVGVFGLVAGVLSLQLAAYITAALLKNKVLDDLPPKDEAPTEDTAEGEEENKTIWDEIL